jgi:UDP-glucose 4-epimerase
LAALVIVQHSLQDPILNFELKLHCTYLAAEIARVHRIPRLVFTSSASFYGDGQTVPLTEQVEIRPISPYGPAKLASESILLGHAAASGFTVCCQRYFNVYGPRQDPKSPYSGVISIFCHNLRSSVAPVIFGDGEQTRDFIFVHDVARANVLAATAPGISSGIANICSGRSTSLNQLATGLRVHFAESPVPIYTAPKAADIRHSLGSPNNASSALGFSAEVSLSEGLSKLALQA